jgi:hypothetical protein
VLYLYLKAQGLIFIPKSSRCFSFFGDTDFIVYSDLTYYYLFVSCTMMAAPMDELNKMGPLGKVEYEICVCERHQLEHCHMCCFDFRDMNKSALEDATNEERLLCRAKGCMAKASKTCQGCKNAKYCGKDCANADWKAKHKHECTRSEAGMKSSKPGAPTKRINMACGHLEDEFVDIFPVNTRLIMYSRNPNRPEPLKGKVLSFNTGKKGVYADPEVKYDPKIRGLNDEDMCTYTLQYEDGSVTAMNCVDVHSEFVVDVGKSKPSCSIVTPPSPAALVPAATSAAVVSRAPVGENQKACADCLKVLPKTCFSGAQVKKKSLGACKACVEARLALKADDKTATFCNSRHGINTLY